MGIACSSKGGVDPDETKMRDTIATYHTMLAKSDVFLDERKEQLTWLQQQRGYLETCAMDHYFLHLQCIVFVSKCVQEFKSSVQQCFTQSKDTLIEDARLPLPLVTVILAYVFSSDEIVKFGGTPTRVLLPGCVEESEV